jgi:hypothetical protein
MKKNLVTAISAALITANAAAQNATVKDIQTVTLKDLKPLEKDGWKKTGTFITTLNQGALRNWAAGGEQNTLGITTLFNYNINHKKGKFSWNNYLDLALGFQDASSFGQFRKVDDHIDLTSKYGYRFSKLWYMALLVNFNTQVLKGYNYTDTLNTKISNFLSPGKILFSAGIDFRPDAHFTLFLSPVTTRWILKTDRDFFSIEKFGVDAGRTAYHELGAFSTAKYSRSFAKWVNYTGRLDLFSNYYRDPFNIDVFFTNLLAFKISKWLGTTLSMDVVYDDLVLKRTQLKEILGLGVAVKL